MGETITMRAKGATKRHRKAAEKPVPARRRGGPVEAAPTARGVRVARHYTPSSNTFPPASFDVKIEGEGGAVVYELEGVEAPKSWGQQAVTIAANKYFRKAGVPGKPRGETSVYDLVERVCSAIRFAGAARGYFDSIESEWAFVDELRYLLLDQRASFNSPVWFNVGLFESYGIKGSGGNWAVDADGVAKKTKNAYERPQCSACFIQSVDDDIDSLYGLLKTEARLFKGGSGTGTNFSSVRSKYEKLSGGGTSSGLISFLGVFDRAAGSTKSGGTTRRAAKMVCLDMDHPEIEAFIGWKVHEGEKARALARAGYAAARFEDEAYATVSGQNANNSVRVTDAFLERAAKGAAWNLYARTDRSVVKTVDAKALWRSVAEAAWACACPGVQYHDTIQRWHTCPNSGAINASNPCSEYMHLDDSACNLASINLVKFLNADGTFDVAGFIHACEILVVAQDILVGYSSYPTKKIAKNANAFRQLGLGFANLGALLMRLGVAYGSEEGRSWAGAITALTTGSAYRASAKIAEKLGAFEAFELNRDPMIGVIKQHRYACERVRDERAGKFGPREAGAMAIWHAADEAWLQALEAGRIFGFRNAQATVLAPTGTIGFTMGCDTTGIEPTFALAAEKELAGGGTIHVPCLSVVPGLLALGYRSDAVDRILAHVNRFGSVEGSEVRAEHLAVFDCAVGAGARFLSPEDHLRMMAACQPFLSGAISKTVNVPESATVDDVQRIYELGHALELKAVAVYRDKSKDAQPLKAFSAAKAEGPAPAPQPAAEPALLRGGWATKRKLPGRRPGGFTQAARVGGHKLFLRTGEYEQGALAEIFVDLAGEGGPMRSWANAFAMAVSIGLQHGVPLDEFVEKFASFGFEPRGSVEGDENIKLAPSVVAYVFRRLALDYLSDDSYAQVKPGAQAASAPAVAPEPAPKASGPRGKATEPCASCGGPTRPSGTCAVCEQCGATSGCS
jgi:ribonucleoside-diphosphate reductase alpha chain